MRAIRFTLVVMALIMVPLYANDALAVNVAPGDYVKFIDRPGSPGGEFGIDIGKGVPVFNGITDFVTFCIEKSEYIDFSNSFYVSSITNKAISGGVGKVVDSTSPTGYSDPLDQRTAWLYYRFITQTLPVSQTLGGYDYNSGNNNSRVASANELQEAIWYAEQEISSTNGLGAFWYAAADAWAIAHPTFDLGIRVMNLKNGGPMGSHSQDQLVHVPEPGTLLLLGSGLIGVAVLARKRIG